MTNEVPIVEPRVPVLVLPFRGGEIHCCHLDGYRGARDAMRRRLEGIEAYFQAKPESARFRIWLNIDETELTPGAIADIAMFLRGCGARIHRLAMVGAGRKRRALERGLAQAYADGIDAPPWRCFADAERAKEWLV